MATRTAKGWVVGLSLLVLSMSARAQKTCQDGTCSAGGPYGGTAVKIPGLIEAEEYDLGGEGVAYSDTTSGNNPGDFRDDDVDIRKNGDGFAINSVRGGEYLRYSVDVATQVDAFKLTFMVASPDGFAGSFRVVSGGTGCDDYKTDISGLVTVKSTGGWKIYEEMSTQGIGGLPAGSSLIWICAVTRGFNIDYFTMEEQPEVELALPGGPYQGITPTVPGLIEAEAFDVGGPEVAYHDTTSGNTGHALRPDQDVDIKQEPFGYVVYWIDEEEYLRYSIDVSKDVGVFFFIFRVYAPFEVADAFHIVTGGSGCDDFTTDLSGLVTVPGRGGLFAGYHEFGVQGINGLPAGSAYVWMCMLNTHPHVGIAIDHFTMTELESVGGPYNGVAATVPGVIQAEEFDEGGQGVGYSDTDYGNNGHALRLDADVDVKHESFGYIVGWIAEGENLRYTIDVSEDVDVFNFIFRVWATATITDAFAVVTGGSGCDDYTTDLSGPVTVPGQNSGYHEFGMRGINGLPAGTTYIWLCMRNFAGYNIDYFTMTDKDISGGPYKGVAATVPGVIQAEEFDEGVQGMAYTDTTPGNQGTTLRLDTDVDIHQESFGYVVGWIDNGESLRYTIDVSKHVDVFYFNFRVASFFGISNALHVVTGGSGCDDYTTDLSGFVTVPGGFGYYDVGRTGIGGLPKGSSEIWLCSVYGGYNIDSFTMLADSTNTITK